MLNDLLGHIESDEWRETILWLISIGIAIAVGGALKTIFDERATMRRRCASALLR